MEELVLRKMYEKYGEAIIFDQKKLRAYLMDMRLLRKSVNLLCDFARLEYFKEFVSDVRDDYIGAVEKLIYYALEEYALDAAAAEFGARCWAYAITEVRRPITRMKPSEKQKAEEIVRRWADRDARAAADAIREMMK